MIEADCFLENNTSLPSKKARKKLLPLSMKDLEKTDRAPYSETTRQKG